MSLGDFASVNGGSIGQVTDIALDKNGVMYAAVFGALYRVEYKSGPPKCTQLAVIGAQFNGLAVIANGTLLGVENSGAVYRIDVDSTGAKVTKLGDYGGYTSSGDIAIASVMPDCARTSNASTLPTPSQLITPRVASKDAMLITAPRVPRNVSWQRRIRSSTAS
jgi:hypothetical protein